MHYAAKNDADNALKMLIKLGADVNCRDYKQRTPLQVAAELGKNEWKGNEGKGEEGKGEEMKGKKMMGKKMTGKERREGTGRIFF